VEGNRLEDFGSDQEFAVFLDSLAVESERDGSEVELIVNGDAFEMLQVPHTPSFEPAKRYRSREYHSSSEEDSVLKMNHIIGGHPRFFEGLRRFLQPGPPRRYVTFVKGNHDLNLHWSAVQQRIRESVGATGPRSPLLGFEERCVSREGIYIEHGNQYAEVVDRIEDMEDPLDPERPGQLALPLGSWFVMNVFNKVERERYWIDGVKPITALVWYALAFDFPFAARAIATLIRALPGIIHDGVLDTADPRAGFVARLEDPDQVQALADRYQQSEAFRTEFNAAVANILAPPPELLGMDAAPLLGTPDPVDMGDQIRRRARSSLFDMAAKRAAEEGARVVSFGHTHDAGVEGLPDGGVYINSGTWTWRAEFSGDDKETWRDLFAHPELFTGDRQLNYVRIDYDDAGQPAGELRIFDPSDVAPPEEPETPPLSWWEKFLAWLRGL
jgi:hypothetical protein